MIWTGIELGFGFALGFWLFIKLLRFLAGLFGISIRGLTLVLSLPTRAAEAFDKWFPGFPYADKNGEPRGWGSGH